MGEAEDGDNGEGGSLKDKVKKREDQTVPVFKSAPGAGPTAKKAAPKKAAKKAAKKKPAAKKSAAKKAARKAAR
jgi:hypothetical protein